jgi:hypothetical protein
LGFEARIVVALLAGTAAVAGIGVDIIGPPPDLVEPFSLKNRIYYSGANSWFPHIAKNL